MICLHITLLGPTEIILALQDIVNQMTEKIVCGKSRFDVICGHTVQIRVFYNLGFFMNRTFFRLVAIAFCSFNARRLEGCIFVIVKAELYHLTL